MLCECGTSVPHGELRYVAGLGEGIPIGRAEIATKGLTGHEADVAICLVAMYGDNPG